MSPAGGIIDLMSMLAGGGVAGVAQPQADYSPLSYPLAMPAVSGPISVQWERDQVVGISESDFSLHRQHVLHTGERWRVTIAFPLMRREHADEWTSFLLAQDSGNGLLLFGDIFNPMPRGSAAGSPVVDGSNQLGETVSIRGFNNNVAGILLPGDKIQIGNQLLQVIRTAATNDMGKAVLDIRPRLRAPSPVDGDVVITNNPKGLFCLDTKSGPIWSEDITGRRNFFGFQIIEAF